MPLLTTKLLHDLVLGEVRILILIHQDVAEEGAVTSPYLGMIPEKLIGLQQQIVEIHRSGLPTALLVTFVDLPNQRHPALQVVLDQLLISLIPLCGDQGILSV